MIYQVEVNTFSRPKSIFYQRLRTKNLMIENAFLSCESLTLLALQPGFGDDSDQESPLLKSGYNFDSPLSVIELLVDIFFVVDILINFRTT